MKSAVENDVFNRGSKRELRASRKLVKDLTRLHTAEQLYAKDKRETLLEAIRAHMQLSERRYHSLGYSLLCNIAHHYQMLPESTTSFYQHAGGLIDHALHRTESALAIFDSYLKPDAQGKFSEIQLQWQYALFSASLLQGIGKLFIDYDINIYDAHGHPLKKWNPLHESLVGHGSYYDYAFTDGKTDENMRPRLNLLLARQLMPVSGFHWIASNPEILAIWLALLDEDLYRSGTLGCVLDNADAVAIQRELDRLHKLYGGKLKRMTRLGTFTDNSAEAQLQIEQQTGVEFIHWVQEALASGTLMINQAPLFAVPGGLLMSAEIFKLFVRDHPDFKNWQTVQKAFTSLGLHESAVDGSAMRKFEQHKNQHLISGIALGSHSAVILPESAKIRQLGSGEVLTVNTTEMINQIYQQRGFQPSASVASKSEGLASLTHSGHWLAVSSTVGKSNAFQFGAKQS